MKEICTYAWSVVYIVVTILSLVIKLITEKKFCRKEDLNRLRGGLVVGCPILLSFNLFFFFPGRLL